MAKKKKGSKNRKKLRLKIARLNAKVADCRMDATHKVYCKIVSENQVICVESLTVKNMMKNPKLAKHIVDANWRVIWHDLSDRFSSYQTCPSPITAVGARWVDGANN